MDISVITRGFHTGVQVVKAHKSEIAWGLSMALRIAAIAKCVHDVMTSEDILDEYHTKSEEIAMVKDSIEEGDTVYSENLNRELTIEDIKKDEKKLVLRTVVKLVDHYKWAMIFEAGSIALDTYGFFSMRKTAVTAIGGLAAANEFIKKYRGRIVEECGKDIDFYAATGLKKVNKDEMPDISVPATDEESKDLTNHWADESDYYKIFSSQTSSYWRNNLNLNIGYLKGIERMATNKLRAQGFLFLNDVLDSLDLPLTEAGCFCGWLYNSTEGDNFVDFGIGSEGEHYIYGEDVYDVDPDVILNFNCLGDISRKFTKFSRK